MTTTRFATEMYNEFLGLCATPKIDMTDLDRLKAKAHAELCIDKMIKEQEDNLLFYDHINYPKQRVKFLKEVKRKIKSI